MTQKALPAVLVAVGLVAGGAMTFAYYAAADSTTSTAAGSTTNAAAAQEENDAAEKVAEQSMTPAQIKAKEDAEVGEKEVGDANESVEKADGKDEFEMDDAAEASLTPAQRAQHDADEAAHESGTGDDAAD